MKKNIVYKKTETLIITGMLLTFIIGFFAGWNFADKSFDNLQLEFETEQLNLKSIYNMAKFSEVFNDEQCDENILDTMSNRLYLTGVELERLENENKLDSENYIYLKQKHNINQVLFYIEYKKFKEKCNTTSNMILFFFNGTEEDNARKQGEEISKLVSGYNLKVLPMDYGYTESLDYFYNFYNIEKLPSIVINYNKTLKGNSNSEEIEKYLIK